MGEIDLYTGIRNEIIINHVLMHSTTIIVVLVILIGIWLIERRESVLCVFLPLLSVAWAAAILRFDFFIHRQASYLRDLETSLKQRGLNLPYWETWKTSVASTKYVVPIADVLSILIVFVPTIYLLFGPAKGYFYARQWRGHLVYAWTVVIVIVLLLALLPLVPSLLV